ncbi:uncharacterized protein LOC143914343 [Arctopsyche grandis]|uniref:uncharacterized protein LOC143914343 n=1 Tax=Arctopsyche grandis TaxID=121162 RepID=UPI00406D862A
MMYFKSLYVLTLMAVVTFVHSETVELEKEQQLTDYPVTIVAVGPPYDGSNNCTVQFYHPSRDAWTTLAEIELNVYNDYSTIISNGKLYIFGGKKNEEEQSDEVISFDLATKEIKKLTPMGQKKKNVGVAKLGEYIYVTGGNVETYHKIGTVERYDPKTDSWSGMAPMLSERCDHASNVYEGKLYVAGGTDESSDAMKSMEIYDPTLNKWTLGTPMNQARSDFSIVFVDGGLFALGGPEKLNADDVFGERFDLNTKQWKHFRNPFEDTMWLSGVVLDDMIFISGSKNNFKYNTKTNEMVKINPNNRFAPNFLLWSTS